MQKRVPNKHQHVEMHREAYGGLLVQMLDQQNDCPHTQMPWYS